MKNLEVPEGWTSVEQATNNSDPPNSVGGVQISEGESIVEDGFINSRQYFLVQTEEGKLYSKVPGLGGKGKDYVGPQRDLRTAALEDCFKVLNSKLPDEFVARASQRFPDSPR